MIDNRRLTAERVYCYAFTIHDSKSLQKHSEAIQKMADQVKINWEKLRRNFEKLAASVDAALNQLAYVI